MVEATYNKPAGKSLKDANYGKLGIVTGVKQPDDVKRIGQVFVTGAYSMIFLWDGGIQDKNTDRYEVRWLEPGEQVVLTQR